MASFTPDEMDFLICHGNEVCMLILFKLPYSVIHLLDTNPCILWVINSFIDPNHFCNFSDFAIKTTLLRSKSNSFGFSHCRSILWNSDFYPYFSSLAWYLENANVMLPVSQSYRPIVWYLTDFRWGKLAFFEVAFSLSLLLHDKTKMYKSKMSEQLMNGIQTTDNMFIETCYCTSLCNHSSKFFFLLNAHFWMNTENFWKLRKIQHIVTECVKRELASI